MNLLDVAITVAAVGAGIGGWRLGFLARLLGWAGVVLGLSVGVLLVPRVVTTFGGDDADARVTAALLFLVLVASVGQAAGIALGLVVRRGQASGPATDGSIDTSGSAVRADRAAGAVLGVAGVLALLWMVIPSLAAAEGWPARAARDSTLVSLIDRYTPDQPARFSAWGRAVAEAPYPSALDPLDEPPDPGAAPDVSLPAEVDAAARAATVRIEGRACRQIQEGTGWVAAPGLVVTNAHVVAGEDQTSVFDPGGGEHGAAVIAFDPARDLALLAVPGLEAPPLTLGQGESGDVGAVYGHPGGGEVRAAPARVGDEIVAVGTDIYRTAESRREVYVLAVALEPGDSGGALVAEDGSVIGVAFAIDPGRSGVAYALTDEEVAPLLDALPPNPSAVSTGPCLVG